MSRSWAPLDGSTRAGEFSQARNRIDRALTLSEQVNFSHADRAREVLERIDALEADRARKAEEGKAQQ